MDIHVSLQHGPLAVEIDAKEDDDYQQELEDLLEFIEKYEERLKELNVNNLESSRENEDGNSTGQASMDRFAGNSTSNGQNQSPPETDNGSEGLLEPLAKKVGTTPAAICEVIDIDPNGEEPPFLLVDTDEFADTKAKQQFISSLLILEVWDECYEADRMKSSLLKDALEYSGVDSSNMSNMYSLDDADSFLNKKGRGGSTTLKLRRPGKREAQRLFRELAQ